MDPQMEALKRMVGDMDDMEGNSVFPPSKGVDITISVIPNTGEEKEEKMEGENVSPEDDEMDLPPFLRKKR